jgi:hypothetical protein
LIGACDREIAQYLEAFRVKTRSARRYHVEITRRAKTKLWCASFRSAKSSIEYRIFGVDLTRIPGVHTLTAQTLLAEIRPDLSQFASAPALTPPGRTLSGQSSKRWKSAVGQNTQGKNRASTAPRMAAQSLYRSRSYLTLGTSFVGCGPNWEVPKRSPPLRTNWRASSTTW